MHSSRAGYCGMASCPAIFLRKNYIRAQSAMRIAVQNVLKKITLNNFVI